MRRSDFYYALPRHLIAQYPSANRRDSRLLYLDGATGGMQDLHFAQLLELIKPNDLLVFNDTRVIPARLYGRKGTGGRLEILVERILGPRRARAQVRSSHSPRQGSTIWLEGNLEVEVIGRGDEFFELQFNDSRTVSELLEEFGHIPLPPYINRADERLDRERYQTVYARHPGAVAAPTAGLHFDEALIASLGQMGVGLVFITLHVGAGTFQPVRVGNLRDHRLHSEYINVPGSVCEHVRVARENGGRIIAVGSTSVRALEAASSGGKLKPYEGETDIFIYPGYKFATVDAMITNFHLPESTLLMLICAFAGRENVLKAYHHAVEKHYRFYSYGDAMFITPSRPAS
ncbi:MAG: tRNA preQ1(34) S-adenosylmethionine ribosyltransferase-isomerase QueA [Gammaproteobacteria bacterium]|nr:tRNA preQ1(34) S-adenosylmethionine ribosyltransferase-isomerase QueA [Gammaproteobacteria bacterium]MCI0590760.1 tRNA preQ1(34) S-adenosylmethionine ribosyltransferase-isomerase QueA [Gammaproteobacteria bacterium]